MIIVIVNKTVIVVGNNVVRVMFCSGDNFKCDLAGIYTEGI